MTPVPSSPFDIDLRFGLFLVAFLVWAWVVGFVLIMVWRTAKHWKSNRWRFSVGQLFVAMTTIALVLGLGVAVVSMFN
jgi:hypothetical protein